MQLEIRNSHRLELIIIWLITIEIALELLKEAAVPGSWPRTLVRYSARMLGGVGQWLA